MNPGEGPGLTEAAPLRHRSTPLSDAELVDAAEDGRHTIGGGLRSHDRGWPYLYGGDAEEGALRAQSGKGILAGVDCIDAE